MSNKKPTILVLHAGVSDEEASTVVHRDYKDELYWLGNRLDVNVVQVNILENGFEQHFKDNDVRVVYTRQLRNWQARKNEFFGPLAKIQGLANTYGALLTNDANVWFWNYDKGEYLDKLSKQGVPIVRTDVFSTRDLLNSERFDKLVMDSPRGLVVKPRAGARADGVNFIVPAKGKKFAVRTPKEAAKGSFDEKLYTLHELKDWFNDYVAGYGDVGVLVQENIVKKLEVSVIFVRGQEPYAVLRTTGEDSWVAHEAFGGLNITLDVVPQEILSFAKSTIRGMPTEVAGAYFHRIDVFVSPDGLRLLEVEDGSPRLFYTETNRKQLYQALADVAVLRSKNGVLEPHHVEVDGLESANEARCADLYRRLNRKAEAEKLTSAIHQQDPTRAIVNGSAVTKAGTQLTQQPRRMNGNGGNSVHVTDVADGGALVAVASGLPTNFRARTVTSPRHPDGFPGLVRVQRLQR